MEISEITIHNFRSIKEIKVCLREYTVLVGENNVGKTNIITVLRMFYEDDSLKYKSSVDFPKFDTDDKESWVEITYQTTEEEQEGLRDEYKNKNNILKVRRYFESGDKDLVKPNQSNIYAYEGDQLSKNLFYGAKNVSQSKLGSVIFIPAVSKTEDTFKTSGRSPFRDMVNFVMKRAVSDSPTFTGLKDAFEKFNTDFREEASKDGFSIKSLINDVNENINTWNVKFGVNINDIKPDEIVKTLLSHYIEDQNLGGKPIDLNALGQGLQRHLIYTLIRLSAKYKSPPTGQKKEFDPDFTLILFEEPEAFLHPSQQEALCMSLKQLANESTEQVLISSHSPIFVSKQIANIPGLIRLHRHTAVTEAYQLSEEDYSSLIDKNTGLYMKFCSALHDEAIDQNLKTKIQQKNLGDLEPNPDSKLEEEGIRYFLWLDAERAALFFAKHVIICEGATEKIFLDLIIDEKWQDLKDKHVYILDAMGKYNIHRYINLLSELGISHGVLMDGDNDNDIHGLINEFIISNRTELTKEIFSFDSDFENFLSIDDASRNELKPLNVIVKYKNGDIHEDNISNLRKIIDTLI